MTTNVLHWLWMRRKERQEIETRPDDLFSQIRALPPFESQIAIVSSQRNKWKLLALVALIFAAASIVTSAVLLQHKLFQKMNSEYIVVPGAAEFLRVRPNLIPDAVVKDFAHFVATYAGNFTYRNAKEHFETVAERMVPDLKGRFLRDAETKFSEWQKRRVDQVFAFEPVEIQVASDKFGAKYVLVARGTRSQYADGTLLQETDENLYLELRPRLRLNPGSRSDESLLLIERLEWVSRTQADALLASYSKNDSERKQ
ncbi:MAG: hypothetical protein RL189_3117 [Pseudomonadota bacterium]|jgi:hypothetical protein